MESSEAGSRRIGRYHLSEPVGGGPTGEVFRAKIHGVAGLDRQFAIKRVHRALLADADNHNSAEELSSALRLYGGLEHPRIARLHEHKLEGNTPYIAVEWCAGIDLARLVDATFGQGRPLPAGAATSLISRAARAVGYAHGRGQTHLGLSPTNLICSPSGEVKVTDFGLLRARLDASPADDTTLLGRLPYLAPEQFADERTSPATDIFTFGALFFELLSGTKAFTGRGGHDIAAAVHAAKPTMDAIPKPLARVLMRCLAHSPLERYPSGGALADAIDAAARGMLMRGDQRDAAKAVQEAKERLETMRRTQASGALSFPMPTPPRHRPGTNANASSALGVPNLELDERVNENATTDVIMPIPPSEGHVRVEAANPTLAKTMMGTGPPTQGRPLASSVVVAPEMHSKSRTLPSRSAHSMSASTSQRRLIGPATNSAAAVFDDGQPTADFQRVAPGSVVVSATKDHAESSKSPANTQPANFDDALGPQTVPFTRSDDEGGVSAQEAEEELATQPAETNHPSVADHSAQAVPQSALGSTRSGRLSTPPMKNTGRKLLIAAITIGAIGIVILAIIIAKRGGAAEDAVAIGPAFDASAKAEHTAPIRDAGVASEAPDARVPVTTAIRDASNAAAKATDAAPTAVPTTPTGSTDLVVTSKPSKATVYLDGTLIGKTPVTVDSGGDSHKLVVIRAGYKLHVAKIDGGETVNIELEEVTPPGGPAGIKVRCKEKNRYYVFVDGLDVGQLCPTERIGVEMGPHTVEIYDPVNEARRRFEVNVTQTRLSSRVRVD